MHPLYGSLPVLYVPVNVKHGAVIAQRYTYAPPRLAVPQNLYFPVCFSVEQSSAGFKSRVNAFLLA